ncbi:hypothetical protein OS493_038771 [Desmophyllum pertusum]|uniref:Transmembrane protein n=1 Tax=Desmophyllum pertusum TaxID=174260 RepID=A0A9W9YUA7_9CNID|nr:hypothetical protein OS493_038771 [Desmophyllum pertusum]
MVHIVAIGLPLLVIWLAQLWIESVLMAPYSDGFECDNHDVFTTKFPYLFSPSSDQGQTTLDTPNLSCDGCTGRFRRNLLQQGCLQQTSFSKLARSYGVLHCDSYLFTISAGRRCFVFQVAVRQQVEAEPIETTPTVVCGSLVFLVACITLSLAVLFNWFVKNVGVYIQYGSILSALGLASVVIGQVYTEYGLKRRPGT